MAGQKKGFNLTDYDYVQIGPPMSDAHAAKGGEDPARYILRPGINFKRPWIANPRSNNAYVWPMGIEGFTLQTSPTLGIHKYIGSQQVDAQVVFLDEFHIQLSGIFPGITSSANANALRKLLIEMPPAEGFILSLPRILKEYMRVLVENHEFTHDPGDYTHSINYSVSFLNLSTGPLNTQPADIPAMTSGVGTLVPAKGKKSKPSSTIKTTGGRSTIRQLATVIYDDPDVGVKELIDANIELLNSLGVQAYQAPNKVFPPGIEFDIP